MKELLTKMAICSVIGVALGGFNLAAVAGNSFKIETAREPKEEIRTRYNFPDGREYKIQATSYAKIQVCTQQTLIGCEAWNEYVIGTSLAHVRLSGLVYIVVPKGTGLVRISIWE